MQKKIWRTAFSMLFLLLVLIPGCGEALSGSAPVAQLRVLFIGNSLTYTNDLPAIVEALAAASGKERFKYKVVAFPDHSLEDHWKRGDARKMIAEGGWDVVVLQQGPSALRESRVLLLEYTRRFAEEIRRAGAKPALFMVWPSKIRSGDFDGVRDSYALAAKEVSGLFFPAGEAWRAAWRRKPDLALYSQDGLHPSLLGSYLSAAVIYQQLYNQKEIKLPARLKVNSSSISKIELSPQEAELLQEAAMEANLRIE
jgi:hypothetical protein